MSKYFKAKVTDSFLFTLSVKAESEDEAQELAEEFFLGYRDCPGTEWEQKFPNIKVIELGGEGGVIIDDEEDESTPSIKPDTGEVVINLGGGFKLR